MKYNPLTDKAVSRIVSEGGVEKVRSLGAMFVRASFSGEVEISQDITSSCREALVFCDTGVSSALVFKNTLRRKLSEACITMPIGLVIDANEHLSVDSVIFLAHGAVDFIYFVMNPVDHIEYQQKAYGIVASINELSVKLVKHFGHRTRIVIRPIFKEMVKETRQANKRLLHMISDGKLMSIELSVEEEPEKEKHEDCIEIKS
jgi:hypothetical protein